MRDYTFGRKKAATSTFSHPSLVSPHTPTLANPDRDFGLPTNNIVQAQTAESANQQAAQSTDEQSLLSETIQQRSFGHDLSRISFRPQAKLTVGEPGDKYEQEADWMANQVMRIVVPDKLNADSVQPVQDSLQRKCAACEEEEEKVQTKPSIQTATDGGLQAGDNIESRLSSSKGGGSPLDPDVRSFMEPRFGADFSGVRVHTGSDAVQMNRELEAQAFTHGSDVYFGVGKSAGNNELMAHELTHVVQQDTRRQAKPESNILQNQPYSEIKQQLSTQTMGRLQRDCDPSVASCPPQSSSNVSSGDNSASDIPQPQQVKQTYESTRDQLLEQGPDCDPQSSLFKQYCSACDALTSVGQSPPNEPTGILLPSNQLLVLDESGQVQLLPDSGDFVEISDDLFPVLDDVANASQSGQIPGNMAGSPEQVLLWEDGRAVFTSASSSDLATLLVQGQPTNLESAVSVGNLGKPWERVRNAGAHSLLTTGLYQLGSHPISKFNGTTLPPGSRIRFADVGYLAKNMTHTTGLKNIAQGVVDTRLINIFDPKSKKFYAWDAHMTPPGSKTPHPFYHVNQKGMHSLFGQSDIAPIPPAMLRQAKALRYIRVGGRVLFVVGVVVDGALLAASVNDSINQGTPRPVIAQAIRTVGSWGGAWAGAKVGCAVGGAAGVETGPGLVLTCIAGGVIGGFAGYAGADWIADMISED